MPSTAYPETALLDDLLQHASIAESDFPEDLARLKELATAIRDPNIEPLGENGRLAILMEAIRSSQSAERNDWELDIDEPQQAAALFRYKAAREETLEHVYSLRPAAALQYYRSAPPADRGMVLRVVFEGTNPQEEIALASHALADALDEIGTESALYRAGTLRKLLAKKDNILPLAEVISPQPEIIPSLRGMDQSAPSQAELNSLRMAFYAPQDPFRAGFHPSHIRTEPEMVHLGLSALDYAEAEAQESEPLCPPDEFDRDLIALQRIYADLEDKLRQVAPELLASRAVWGKAVEINDLEAERVEQEHSGTGWLQLPQSADGARHFTHLESRELVRWKDGIAYQLRYLSDEGFATGLAGTLGKLAASGVDVVPFHRDIASALGQSLPGLPPIDPEPALDEVFPQQVDSLYTQASSPAPGC